MIKILFLRTQVSDKGRIDMYCLAHSEDEYVYGKSKKVKNYLDEKMQLNWKLQFFPKENLLLDVVHELKEEEGKKVTGL